MRASCRLRAAGTSIGQRHEPAREVVILMRKGGLIVAGATVMIGAAVALGQVAFPTYTYRYRLTLDFDIDGKHHSGSSVIEISWRGHRQLPNGASFTPVVR